VSSNYQPETPKLLVAPEIPVSLRILERRSTLKEPGVLVGGMVRHKIEDHFEAATVRLFKENLEVVERTEDGIDVAIVGDVIAKIGHRRWKYG
jgi:hypothetical protein